MRKAFIDSNVYHEILHIESKETQTPFSIVIHPWRNTGDYVNPLKITNQSITDMPAVHKAITSLPCVSLSNRDGNEDAKDDSAEKKGEPAPSADNTHGLSYLSALTPLELSNNLTLATLTMLIQAIQKIVGPSDANGKEDAFVVSVTDISALKEPKKYLETQHTKYRLDGTIRYIKPKALENASSAIWEIVHRVSSEMGIPRGKIMFAGGDTFSGQDLHRLQCFSILKNAKCILFLNLFKKYGVEPKQRIQQSMQVQLPTVEGEEKQKSENVSRKMTLANPYAPGTSFEAQVPPNVFPGEFFTVVPPLPASIPITKEYRNIYVQNLKTGQYLRQIDFDIMNEEGEDDDDDEAEEEEDDDDEEQEGDWKFDFKSFHDIIYDEHLLPTYHTSLDRAFSLPEEDILTNEQKAVRDVFSVNLVRPQRHRGPKPDRGPDRGPDR